MNILHKIRQQPLHIRKIIFWAIIIIVTLAFLSWQGKAIQQRLQEARGKKLLPQVDFSSFEQAGNKSREEAGQKLQELEKNFQELQLLIEKEQQSTTSQEEDIPQSQK